ncbi:MAG: sulfatase-like hydrolase/transferase [Sedimentisphaerales bacterium]|nr:sulfatase-like hydrolase/transferase [Sedimentisphaerales bacterium]
MSSESIKNVIKAKREQFNRAIFDYSSARPYTIIMLLALLCTLTVKLFYAKRNLLTYQYPGWILSDISFFLGIEVIFAFSCFCYPRKRVIRTVTIISAVICFWSFLNAGWLIRTGTQILPRVLLTLIRDPLTAFQMVGKNLTKVPITSILLLTPGVIAILFFGYILTKPRNPNYNKRRFFIRFVISVIICLSTILLRPVLIKARPSQTVSLELQYNAQIKAIVSLVSNNHKPPTEPTRRVPFNDQITVPIGIQKQESNIIVIVLEGVQYAYTSFGEKSKDSTPYLVNLAKQGACFTNMRSTLTHTTKALFTLMTGRYASASQDIVEAVPISKPYASLATILEGQLDYRTAFFQSARGNFECRPGLVHNLGFDKFWARDDLDDPNKYVGYLGSDEYALIEPIKEWVSSDNKPFLLTIMCSVTHDTYEVPEWYSEQAKEEIDRYRQTIEYTDEFLKSFERELSQLGIMENTIFCVVGDHGEAFDEHGQSGHDRIAYDEFLHVPFCIKAPNIEPGKVIYNPVSSIDLTPTLLSLLGFNTEKAGFDGINVLGSINDERKVFFSGWMYVSQAGFVQGKLKYIYDPVHEVTSLYDLQNDPNEKERMDIPEEQAQAIIDEIETWRENTIFQYDQEYKGRNIIFDKWLCKWGNRNSSAEFLKPEQAREFVKKNK